jgi:adenylylsulfate kinase
LVYVRCSLEEAERRDPKGLYAAARAGNIDQFTGVNHPFQEPHNPDVIVNTDRQTVEQSVADIIEWLSGKDVVENHSTNDAKTHVTPAERRQIRDTLSELGHI